MSTLQMNTTPNLSRCERRLAKAQKKHEPSYQFVYDPRDSIYSLMMFKWRSDMKRRSDLYQKRVDASKEELLAADAALKGFDKIENEIELYEAIYAHIINRKYIYRFLFAKTLSVC